MFCTDAIRAADQGHPHMLTADDFRDYGGQRDSALPKRNLVSYKFAKDRLFAFGNDRTPVSRTLQLSLPGFPFLCSPKNNTNLSANMPSLSNRMAVLPGKQQQRQRQRQQPSHCT
jgi:hypothetical protein